MTLASDILNDLERVFLTDFAVTVTATTWGTEFRAIFDRDYVEYADVSGVAPSILMRAADIPACGCSGGDLFTVAGVAYKLVDEQVADQDMIRVILALA